jgi:hypothetical protein
MGDFNRARLLLRKFKGESYVYGLGVLPQVGTIAAAHGKRAVLVRNRFAGNTPHLDTIRHALEQAGVDVFAEVEGAAPNAPRKDLKRITDVIGDHEPVKNPQLKMKLENMPVPLTAESVDEYMGPILQAAKTGDLSVIKNVPVKAMV